MPRGQRAAQRRQRGRGAAQPIDATDAEDADDLVEQAARTEDAQHPYASPLLAPDLPQYTL